MLRGGRLLRPGFRFGRSGCCVLRWPADLCHRVCGEFDAIASAGSDIDGGEITAGLIALPVIVCVLLIAHTIVFHRRNFGRPRTSRRGRKCSWSSPGKRNFRKRRLLPIAVAERTAVAFGAAAPRGLSSSDVPMFEAGLSSHASRGTDRPARGPDQVSPAAIDWVLARDSMPGFLGTGGHFPDGTVRGLL